MENKIYCVYSNKYILYSEANSEHIIPLSLGGKNGFEILVNKKINAKLGTELDAGISKDFLINSVRREKGFKGHSRKAIRYKVNARISATNEKVEIYYTDKENYLYNPITKKIYTNEEKKDLPLNVTANYEKNIRIKFVAKTLLSAGYFLFKDLFVKYVDHDSLRKIMNWDTKNPNDAALRISVGLIDEFTTVSDIDKQWKDTFKTVCRAINCSCVIFVIGSNQMIGAVGIGGRFISSINFRAEGKKFAFDENKGEYDGVIVGIQNGKIIKGSYNKLLRKIIDKSKNAD